MSVVKTKHGHCIEIFFELNIWIDGDVKKSAIHGNKMISDFRFPIEVLSKRLVKTHSGSMKAICRIRFIRKR